MAKKRKKKSYNKKPKNRTALIISVSIIALILGMIILFLLNNFTTQGIYNFVSCKYNKNSCECDQWNGQCTQEIEDQCCDYVDIRWCGGIVGDPLDCYDKYCEDQGNKCVPRQRIDGRYDCTCVDVEGEFTSC